MIGRRVNAVVNWLVSGLGRISGYAVLAMTLLITMDVILRFAFNAPTKFATETSEYLLIVAVSMGLAYTLRERAHIRIDFVVSRLPKQAANWLQPITSFLALIFTSVLLWLSWRQFLTSFTLKTTSRTGMDVVLWPTQLFIPLGLLVISLLLILNIYAETRVALGKVEETKPEERQAEL